MPRAILYVIVALCAAASIAWLFAVGGHGPSALGTFCDSAATALEHAG